MTPPMPVGVITDGCLLLRCDQNSYGQEVKEPQGQDGDLLLQRAHVSSNFPFESQATS